MKWPGSARDTAPVPWRTQETGAVRVRGGSTAFALGFDPGEGSDHLHGFGRDLLAENALEDGTVNFLDLHHAVTGQEQMNAALVAQLPATALAVHQITGTRSGRGELLSGQFGLDLDVGTLHGRRW